MNPISHCNTARSRIYGISMLTFIFALGYILCNETIDSSGRLNDRNNNHRQLMEDSDLSNQNESPPELLETTATTVDIPELVESTQANELIDPVPESDNEGAQQETASEVSNELIDIPLDQMPHVITSDELPGMTTELKSVTSDELPDLNPPPEQHNPHKHESNEGRRENTPRLIDPLMGSDVNNEITTVEDCEARHLTRLGNQCADYPDYLATELLPDMTQLPIRPNNVEYLGVLLDAGRHWFPIPWIKNLIQILSLMNYNLLHFRLTDDQAFNVRFDSHPKLASAAWNAPDNNTVYTTDELRDLVEYAYARNVIIMPEINVPGHAGGWAGELPYIVVPCATFICDKGYGVPLNMSYVGLYDMLRDIINETRSIFHTSPYLHLGGDELHMSEPCFRELGIPLGNYSIFEDQLRKVTSSLGIEEEYIVRWETSQPPAENRVGKVVHWWESLRFQDSGKSWAKPSVFVSKGLYFDTNEMQGAFEIFERTKQVVQHHKRPIGIIAGTFELGPDDWRDRNVVGRLLSVAMALSELVFETNEKNFLFNEKYMQLCTLLKLPAKQCLLYGVPAVEWTYWRGNKWNQLTGEWRRIICTRLTESKDGFVHSTAPLYLAKQEVLPAMIGNFWKHFGEVTVYEIDPVAQVSTIDLPHAIATIRDHGSIPFTGIVLDITRPYGYFSPLITATTVLDFMFLLGFNMLQLRIMNDAAFAVSFNAHPLLSNVQYPYNTATLKEINAYAKERGITIIPEISLSTRAGGWSGAGHNTPCPNLICSEMSREMPSLSVNINDSFFLSAVSSVLYDLGEIFGTGYLHIGYNDRKESMPCFEEAQIVPDFDAFEAKIEQLLEFHGYDLNKVVRWEERSERDRGTRRAGKITHFKETIGSASDGQAHFASTGLALDAPKGEIEDGYGVYQNVRTLVNTSPMAVLAIVGTLQRWQLISMQERLIAVAIGLSQPDLSSEDFYRAFQTTCEAFPTSDIGPKNCSKMGKISDPDMVKQQFADELLNLRGETCRMRAVPSTFYFPKPGVLIPF